MDYIMKVAGGELPLLSIFGGDYESKDGTPVRDFIHIVDLAKAHVAAIEPMGEKIKSGSKDNFKIYNVGTNKPYTVLEIVKRFSEVNKVDVPYVIADRRQGDIGISYADNSLIIKELNWRPQYDLDDMCRDAWLWYKKSNEID